MRFFMHLLPLVVSAVVLLQCVWGQSIDEIIANSANTSREFDFFYDENNHIVKVELDLKLTYEQYNEYYGANEEDMELVSRKKRTAAIKLRPERPSPRWTNNVVYYQIRFQDFNFQDREEIRKAIQEWERYTCLDFRQTSTVQKRIILADGVGCASYFGMPYREPYKVSLGKDCRWKRVVLHELGHAIGLFHEQTRPDRDQHVTIVRSNVISDMFYNFKKGTGKGTETFGIPYDYLSIMHYGAQAFTKNGGKTILTRDKAYEDWIGMTGGLSFRDIKTVNVMHDCKRHIKSCTKVDSDCPGEGFVGKDCTCWCQGPITDKKMETPITPCSTTTGPQPTPRPTIRPTPRPTPRPFTPRPTPRPTGCQDLHTSCSAWAAKGECDSNPGYMHESCKKSCRKCGGDENTCKDTHVACAKWLSSGYCNKDYQDVVRPLCKKSCGICKETTNECTNKSPHCQAWADQGECQKNPEYMLTSCAKACQKCGNCVNKHQSCQAWADLGECQKNPGYMMKECQLACNNCGK